MCDSNEHITLAQSEHCQISWCRACKSYSLIYKSTCLSFIQDEIVQFRDMLVSLEALDFNYDFKGQHHAIIRNQYSYMGICLTKRDVSKLLDTINQAIFINEAFQIIYK